MERQAGGPPSHLRISLRNSHLRDHLRVAPQRSSRERGNFPRSKGASRGDPIKSEQRQERRRRKLTEHSRALHRPLNAARERRHRRARTNFLITAAQSLFALSVLDASRGGSNKTRLFGRVVRRLSHAMESGPCSARAFSVISRPSSLCRRSRSPAFPNSTKTPLCMTSMEEQWPRRTPERAVADAFAAFRHRDAARLAELTVGQPASMLGRVVTRLPEIFTDSVRCLIVGRVLESRLADDRPDGRGLIGLDCRAATARKASPHTSRTERRPTTNDRHRE